MRVPLLAWAAGLALLLGEPLLSGGAVFPGDPGITRFHHYLLENATQGFLGNLPTPLRSPAYFWPTPKLLPLWGAGLATWPFYLPWRAVADPDAAFVLWLATLASLCFWTFYRLGRKPLGLSPQVASLAAFAFAFAGPRATQLRHLELLSGFYVVAALEMALRIFGKRSAIKARSAGAKRLAKHRATPAVLAALCVLLSLPPGRLPAFKQALVREDEARFAKLLDPHRCEYFYLSPRFVHEPGGFSIWLHQTGTRFSPSRYQLNALWLQLQTGVPTLNGFGPPPPSWPKTSLYDFAPDSGSLAQQSAALRQALDHWIEQAGLDPKGLCWLNPEVAEPSVGP